jgi:outer membrane protein OmpA-like peptidoglycan-associated protein
VNTRFRKGDLLTALASLMMLLFVTGCSGGNKPGSTAKPESSSSSVISTGTASLGMFSRPGRSPSNTVQADACRKIFTRTVPNATDRVLLVVDATASMADQPIPLGLIEDLREVSKVDGSLTIMEVSGARAPPRIVAKDVALSTPGDRSRPSVSELADRIPACVSSVYLSTIKPVGTGTDLYRTLALAEETLTSSTRFWTVTDLLANTGQLNLTVALLRTAPKEAAKGAAHTAPLNLHGAVWHLAGLGATVDPMLPHDRGWLKTFAVNLCMMWKGAGCDEIKLDQANPERAGSPGLPADPRPSFPGLIRVGCSFTLEDVAFAADHATLARGADGLIRGEPLAMLRTNPHSKVKIVGHAASVPGSPEAALVAFSLRRAHAVARVLTAAGIAADRITVAGVGDTEPLAEDIDPRTGKQIDKIAAKERRVELLLSGITTACRR